METLLYILLFSPSIPATIAMIFLIKHLIGWIKEDTAWYSYEAAYDKWVEGGKIGEMPKHEYFL